MTYKCRIIADSLAPCGKRMTSIEATLPRVVLPELRTHRQILQDDEAEVTFTGVDEAGRQLSINSASSRAVPVDKVMRGVMESPYVPEFTGAKKGMQGAKVEDADWQARQVRRTLAMRDFCAAQVQLMLDDGVHKQDANRYLEPFAWHTVLISATEWSNFFAQRCDVEMTYPPFYRLACLIRDAIDASTPVPLQRNEWHLPYVQDDEYDLPINDRIELSVARSARNSYCAQHGVRDVSEDYRLFDRLLGGKHMSPTEHVAMALATPERSGNLVGFQQYRKLLADECR